MTPFAIFIFGFFILWMGIFSHKTYATQRKGQFKIKAVRDLWPMTLGVGIGIFIYNYELEHWLQSQIDFLPLSVTSLRATCSLILVIFFYYNAIDEHTKFKVNRWMKPFLIVSCALIILVDAIFHESLPYNEFQVWMTLLILPPSLLASIMISDITKTILREEVAPLNRAHYYWWLLELIASSLSAFIFLGDAIYKVYSNDFSIYTPAVIVAQILYLILAVAAQARIILPPQYSRYIFYFEKGWTYMRLRFILTLLEQRISFPRSYYFERFWIPSYDRLELEIHRSFITIMDMTGFLDKADQHLIEQFSQIRAARKSYSDTIRDILKVKFS